jgi:quercetin dioxygenase-like cupin family protein
VSLVRLDLGGTPVLAEGFGASVLLEHDRMKVRRIELAAGARIPPCQMQEDVVFVVLSGRVTFRSDGEDTLVASPGAVFIPGGATTRSMEAHEPSLVLGVLCQCGVVPKGNGGTSRP